MHSTPKDAHYARLRRQYRDQKERIDTASQKKGKASRPTEETIFIYGMHSCIAALQNPQRKLHQLYLTKNAETRLKQQIETIPCSFEIVHPKTIDQLVTHDAIHQGIVLKTAPLKTKNLSQLTDTNLILILDQITDPHNVGAIMRSAVAFNAGALITTHRHSPQESGVLAKAASGALEYIEHITVRNLANALDELHQLGFQSYGLDSEGNKSLEEHLNGQKIALVLGAEGKGLRQKTRETVTMCARLDIAGPIKSLNVSNAAAIALYSAVQFLKQN